MTKDSSLLSNIASKAGSLPAALTKLVGKPIKDVHDLIKFPYEASGPKFVIGAILLFIFVLFIGYSQFLNLFFIRNVEDKQNLSCSLSKTNENILFVATTLLIITIIIFIAQLLYTVGGMIASQSINSIFIPPFIIDLSPNQNTSFFQKILFGIICVAFIGVLGYLAYAQFMELDLLNKVNSVSSKSVCGELYGSSFMDADNGSSSMRDNLTQKDGEPSLEQKFTMIKVSSYIIIVFLTCALLSLIVFHHGKV